MNPSPIFLRQKISQTIRQKQIGRIKLAHFLSLPEGEFRKLIAEIEDRPLFQELMHKCKVIGYRKFTGIRIPPSFSFNEQISPSANFDLENLLHENPKTISVLKKVGAIIGMDRFGQLLYRGTNVNEIIDECKLTKKEGEIFKAFLNKFELEKITRGAQDSFAGENVPLSTRRTFTIAIIKKEGDELVIYPYSEKDYLVKGRYHINYNQFEQLCKEKQISQEKINRVPKILRMLNLINQRTTTIYRIIHYIKEKQDGYLSSGNIDNLKPLTRRELADKMGIHPSSITRVMFNKSIITPQGEEKPLRFFFPSRKEIVKGWIKNLIEEERNLLQKGILQRPLTDELIKTKLYQNHHIIPSRRAVAEYRKELKIPASSKRK